ncbi:MAG: 3-hydroxyacyl-CoA dehydrogenase NAD-binding domain-containing protein [Bacteroidia bacterium]
MVKSDIKSIAVAGAGTMGAGIAEVMARAGYAVLLFDISADMLHKANEGISGSLQSQVDKGKLTATEKDAILLHIALTTDVNELQCDLLIEAIVEKLEVKQQFFKAVAAINPQDTILASNTSSIPITRIAAGIPNPERFLGIHFFNPAPVMKLVEIISGVETDPAVVTLCKNLIEKTGKTCVNAADAPGFIVNRVARHYYVEGLKLAEEQVADISTIDALMENNGFKMGPFRLMDLIGVDTNFAVTSSMFALFHQDAKFRPSRIQQQKVDAGHHGRKSGKGFYTYE